MLQDARRVEIPQPSESAGHGSGGGEFLDLDRILAAARRQWRLCAAFAVVGLLLGIAYVLTSVPQYTAFTDILIDQGENRIVDQFTSGGGSTQAVEDEAAILSQVELLKSNQIGFKVIDKLNLTEDPILMHSAPSLLGQAKAAIRSMLDLSRWFGNADEAVEQSPAEKRQATLLALSQNLGIARLERTYVVRVSYTSPDRNQAAEVAQAFAEAYLTDQLDSKYEATRRASGWLQQRIEELRQQSLNADLAVQRFRADNGLISADGQLVSDQRLKELTTQLNDARAQVATAEARADRVQSLINAGNTDAVVNDALVSQVINELRTKYLDTSRRETELSARLGPNHVQVQRLEAELDNYRQLMFGELGRIAASYRNDLQVAQARERAILASVKEATETSASANTTQVQLRELERESDTYRNLYQTFLQRYQEAVQQQSFPITEARVIAEAQVPVMPSKPRKTIALALAVFLGAAAGAGLGAFREFRDRFFRRGDQVRDELGLEFLGAVPLVESKPIKTRGRRSGEAPSPEEARLIAPSQSVARYVVDHPMSSFAETMRSAKLAADLGIGGKSKVIGMVSVLPSEGKSTVSANFAELMAMHGARVLLIDGDIRNPGLTRSVASHAGIGLIEAVVDRRPLREVIMQDPQTNLAFVPAVIRHRISHTADLLASEDMEALLAEASTMFDYIVIDLPPLAPVVDVRAVASKIDGFVFVVEWGRTARRAVRSSLAVNPQVAEKCLGVILNKVDSAKMKLYREFGSQEYYASRYSAYYQQGT